MNEKLSREFFYDRATKPTTPSFNTESSYSHVRESLFKESGMEKGKDISNSASVANCIRSLNQKVSLITSENLSLKEYNNQLLSELRILKEKNVSYDDARSIICSYKEKCIILEQSNELFQKKLYKFEENNGNYEALKSELILINKELSKEIEKNQRMNLLNNKLEDEKLFLQTEIEQLKNKTKETNSTSIKSGYYEEIKLKEYENQNKFLEEMLEKQQNELDDKRRQIDMLKNNILELEDNVYNAKKKELKTESYMQEISEMNERLLKALKKKNCRQRAMTPDIITTKSISKSHSGTFSNHLIQSRM